MYEIKNYASSIYSSYPPPKNAKILALTGLAASAFFAANPAQAGTFTYNGTTYELTTKTGSPTELLTDLQANPWWGNVSMAEAFAQNEANNATPDQILWNGSYHATAYHYSNDYHSNVLDSSVPFMFFGTPSVLSSTTPNMSYPLPFAFATPVVNPSSAVPEPLTILGAMTAAGFSADFKRKLAKARKDQEDA